MAAQDVNRRPAREEIEDHLPGHGLRIRADALFGNAVVGRERKDHFLGAVGPQILSNGDDPCRNFFQPPKAARWLCQTIEPPAGSLVPFLPQQRHCGDNLMYGRFGAPILASC